MNKWETIYGSIDFEKFSPEQQTELRKGLDLGLPMQMFANPDFSAEEIRSLRSVLQKTAYAHSEPEREDSLKDLYRGFRSEINFQLYPDRVCYVPENWDFADGYGYTRNDFLALCNGDPQQAQALFNECEWQHPETILDENAREAALELDEDFVPSERIQSVIQRPSLTQQIASASLRTGTEGAVSNQPVRESDMERL